MSGELLRTLFGNPPHLAPSFLEQGPNNVRIRSVASACLLYSDSGNW